MIGILVALILLQEMHSLLEKGAIVEMLQSQREFSFYSQYFPVPKTDSSLQPNLDLHLL